ncbi:hypothetical protein GLOIN_2v1537221 [Rhizophagus clarus]|uniref:Uncharacterized protein n=1 Tax=Rhizophagus clarus TaxID=94130 RepID=A0A8H3R4Q9_9GLOM|nr:hypothetical protein GLOIN_2v1537221 [Rhizophagus clarus]
MLDIVTLQWSIPQFNRCTNLVFHTATLIDKLMLLAFDELTNPFANIPKLQFPSTSDSSNAVSSNRAAIVGLSVGIVLIVLAVVGAF